MNCSILQTQSNDSATLAILHQQVQGEVLDEVVTVVSVDISDYHEYHVHLLTSNSDRRECGGDCDLFCQQRNNTWDWLNIRNTEL